MSLLIVGGSYTARTVSWLGATDMEPSKVNLAALIDHTLLKPDATEADIVQLCLEAKLYGFGAVCVNPCYVKIASKFLTATTVKVCSVIGFPLGSTLPEVKRNEAEFTIANGAIELDMVINIGALKSKDDALVLCDIQGVVDAARQVPSSVVKVIIETVLLSEEEKIRACKLAVRAGADFVKTSTGFAGGGATVADLRLMRQTVGSTVGVKASGGIKNLQTALEMLEAGATRIGTSSGVEIIS